MPPLAFTICAASRASRTFRESFRKEAPKIKKRVGPRWPLSDPSVILQKICSNSLFLLLRQISAIGRIVAAGNERGLVRCQPQHQFGDLFGFAQTPDRVQAQ